MQIVFASDANYFHGLAVALTSLLKHTSGLDRARIHILDGGLKDSQRRFLERAVSRQGQGIVLEFHALAAESFAGMRLMAGSALTYARLLLPDLLEGISTALYLDVDVYYGADLSALWQVELDGSAIAAAPDTVIWTLGRDGPWLDADSPDRKRPYFNAGVLKMDLDYWRRHEVGARSLARALAEPKNCRHWDQTVLNHLLMDSTTWIPEYLNHLMARDNLIDSGRLPCAGRNLHYIAQPKPWTRHSGRPSFKHWRDGYASEVSRWPKYMLDYDYWALFVWRELLLGSRAFLPACRFLLASNAYRLIPGLTVAKLRSHLNSTAQFDQLKSG